MIAAVIKPYQLGVNRVQTISNKTKNAQDNNRSEASLILQTTKRHDRRKWGKGR